MQTVRVVIADDNDFVRASVKRLVAERFEVVAEASDGAELLDIVDHTDPDVILLDISMPLVDGIEAANTLKERGCDAAVVFVTVHRLPDMVETALATGAAGYVLKSRADRDLIPAIEAAVTGRRYLSAPLQDSQASPK